jgi:predicted AAA+ superfamily ATPase
MKTDYIPQAQLPRLKDLVAPGKVVVVHGPRRVGKTTLLHHYAAQVSEDILFVTGEDITVREYLESQSIQKLTAFVGSRKLLLVDEAQYVREIGRNLKLLVDHLPDLRIVATGSSSFDLANTTGEPLTGRKYTLLLLPLAQLELNEVEAPHETAAALELRLLYGCYPEVILLESNTERERYLRELVASWLFKDILQLEDVRHADRLSRLLQLLAFQIGNQISVAELGTQLGMSKNTVDRYLDLLEKVFVIYARRGFSRNLRKEISKSRRYYFFDNGIRNALINNFNPLSLRDDVGALWENYAVTERLKANLYLDRQVESYFWRTYERQEIDLVEERAGHLAGFEMKWSPPRSTVPPTNWARAYPDASFSVVHRGNYMPFLTHREEQE